jgi:hypothetical protein
MLIRSKWVDRIQPGFNPMSANLSKASAGRMYFVPEGQPDSSQARSAWSHEENSRVPAGRLNGSRLRLDARNKNVMKICS